MKKLGGLQWIIILLTLATAVIHLFLGVSSWGDGGSLPLLFALNGVGYIVLIALLYFSNRDAAGRSAIRWVLILYTLLTIVLYFVMQPDPFSNTIGLVTKAIEALLIILLFVDRSRDHQVSQDAELSAARSVTVNATTAAVGAAAVTGAVVGDTEIVDEEAEDAWVDAGDAAAVAAAAVVVGSSDDEVVSYDFGDIDDIGVEAFRIKLIGHLQALGDTTQFDEPIEYVRGVDDAYGKKLRGHEAVVALDLLVLGATRKGRGLLAKATGISESQILTWTNQVDLYRIKGVAQVYAPLLEKAGVDTVVELAQRNPTNLQKKLLEVSQETNITERPPHLSEVQSWVAQAKNLPRVMHY